MAIERYPAVFARGGTSKALIFKATDLPADREARDRIFMRALGSPDGYGRQLNGLGGGISSLSKIVIVEPSDRPDADVDYTFAQVAVDVPVVDYASTCGNMSSAVGPFAVDEGLVSRADGEAMVRVFNTNTSKIYHASFAVREGQAVEHGTFSIPGVSGTGARIRLDYLDPGGAATGRLLPTGRAVDTLEVPGIGPVAASMVDATNPIVTVAAEVVGLRGNELPEALDAKRDVMAALDQIRRAAGVAMGFAEAADDVPLSNPKVAVVAPPLQFAALDGREYGPDDMMLTARILSMGSTHRALPLTGAMCLAVAARIDGTIVQQMTRGLKPDGDLLIGNPSGVLPADAEIARTAGGGIEAVRATVYRTQRRLIEGWVRV
jgi:2-methylaconitate cis-trans-isomerase PrpF